MESILQSGINPTTGGYNIPANENVVLFRVNEQLQIIQTLRANENSSKMPKTDEVDSSGNLGGNAEHEPVPSTSSGHSLIADKPNDSVNKDSVATNRTEAKFLRTSLADFFNERRQTFQAKSPEAMQALSPPLQQPRPNQMNSTEHHIPARLKYFLPLILPKGRMAEKLRSAAPYNFFLTAVTASPPTHIDPSFITFLDLLDPSLGELESSVQLNFTVNLSWLVAQYTAARQNHLPLIIFYGEGSTDLETVNLILPNVTSFMIKVPGSYGCHHAKVMLFFYKDKSMRVVVSSANLYQDDWDDRVQGVWVSEKLSALSSSSTNENVGESVTNFRKDLVRFLKNYNNPTLQPHIDRIKKSDFSSVKVFLITSIPGNHHGDAHGHLRLRALLKENSAPINEEHPIIMQSSSLGNFGQSVDSYLKDEIMTSMSENTDPSKTRPDIKLIYPSLNNVKQSHHGLMGGGCLTYMRAAHSRQPWLNQHLYQWKCLSRNCNRAMPHIKNYCRYSENGLYWFVLTSANMSKSAWGVMKKKRLNINSYEVGVAFFPRLFLDGNDLFPTDELQQARMKGNPPIFKLPYDLPLVPYEKNDNPFVMNDMMEYREMLMAMQAQEMM